MFELSFSITQVLKVLGLFFVTAIAEVLAENPSAPLFRMGLNDVIGRSGEPDELAAFYGLDIQSIKEKARQVINKVNKHEQ